MASTPPQEIVYGLAALSTSTSDICFAAYTHGLRRSSDAGATWKTVFESLDPNVLVPTTSVALSPGFLRDGCVLAGAPGAIIASRDGGETWSSASLPLPSPFISVLALSPGFERDGIAFAGTMEDGVFLTADHGHSWVAWNLGLLDRCILSLAVSPAFERDQTLFAGTESGVFVSYNGGRFWQETTFPIDNAPVLSLALSPTYADDGLLYVGTESHGLFSACRPWQHWQALASSELDGAINSVLLAPGFPVKPDLLILLDDHVLISRDAGQSWWPCCADDQGGNTLTAITAPRGLDPGCPLIVGCTDGQVRRYTIDT